jgi:hypothetical protein
MFVDKESNGKLAINAACCDVLVANAQAASESTKRMDMIRDAVKEMAEQLQHYQCGVLETVRSVKDRTAILLEPSFGSDAERLLAYE